jgi:hypothetical protein
MDAHLIGELVDKAIPLLGGLYGTWLGYRSGGLGNDPTGRGQKLQGILKVVGPLLVLWSLGSLAMVATTGSDQQHDEVDRAAVIRSINDRMPMLIDDETRMDRVEDVGDHVLYSATLLNITSEQGLPDGWLERLAAFSRDATCADAAQRDFLAKLGPVRTEYSFANGGSAGGFTVAREHCD